MEMPRRLPKTEHTPVGSYPSSLTHARRLSSKAEPPVSGPGTYLFALEEFIMLRWPWPVRFPVHKNIHVGSSRSFRSSMRAKGAPKRKPSPRVELLEDRTLLSS